MMLIEVWLTFNKNSTELYLESNLLAHVSLIFLKFHGIAKKEEKKIMYE